jgi:hypothetical protein
LFFVSTNPRKTASFEVVFLYEYKNTLHRGLRAMWVRKLNKRLFTTEKDEEKEVKKVKKGTMFGLGYLFSVYLG